MPLMWYCPHSRIARPLRPQPVCQALATLAIGLLLLASSPGYGQERLRIVAQEGGERFYPLLQSVYQAMGMQVEFSIQPSARALFSVSNGSFDAEVGRIPAISGDYPNIVYSLEPLLSVQLVALVRKDSPISLSSDADLSNYRLGYLIGMSVAEAYLAETGLTATAVTTHKQLAALLSAGRIDVVIMGTAFRDAEVFSLSREALKIRQHEVFHIFNIKHVSLVPLFDQSLRAAKADGRYERLLLSTYQ